MAQSSAYLPERLFSNSFNEFILRTTVDNVLVFISQSANGLLISEAVIFILLRFDREVRLLVFHFNKITIQSSLFHVRSCYALFTDFTSIKSQIVSTRKFISIHHKFKMCMNRFHRKLVNFSLNS
jgi:hypothetical protein